MIWDGPAVIKCQYCKKEVSEAEQRRNYTDGVNGRMYYCDPCNERRITRSTENFLAQTDYNMDGGKKPMTFQKGLEQAFNYMATNQLIITRIPDARDLPMPSRGSPGSSGLDLYAHITNDQKEEVFYPGEYRLISAGIRLVIPQGHEVQIRPRSGLAIKFGISIVNSPSTIDNDYRGEIKVPIINLGIKPYIFRRGDRFAQMVVCPVNIIDPIELMPHEYENIYCDTERGEAGFGSTGTN